MAKLKTIRDVFIFIISNNHHAIYNAIFENPSLIKQKMRFSLHPSEINISFLVFGK